MKHRRLRARGGRDDGYALAEALITVALVGLIAGGVATAIAAVDRGTQTSRTTDAALNFARGRIEVTRRIGYSSIAHLTGSLTSDPAVVAGMFDPDGATGPLAAEPILHSATGSVVNTDTFTHQGTTYTGRTYVTSVSSDLKRVTSIVTWTQGGQPRTTSVSSLIARTAAPTAAAADAVHDSATGGHQVSARSKRGGGTQQASANLPTPIPGWTMSGGTALTTTVPGTSHHSSSTVSSATISLSGLAISMNGIAVEQTATPGGGIVSTISGNVTINGVSYVNPVAGTSVTVGPFTVTLGYTLNGSDGSRAVSFLRIVEAGASDRHVAWSWIKPVVPY